MTVKGKAMTRRSASSTFMIGWAICLSCMAIWFVAEYWHELSIDEIVIFVYTVATTYLGIIFGFWNGIDIADATRPATNYHLAIADSEEDEPVTAVGICSGLPHYDNSWPKD